MLILRHATITAKSGYLLMLGRDRLVEQIIRVIGVDDSGRTTLEVAYMPEKEAGLRRYATYFQRTDDNDEMKGRLESLEKQLADLAIRVLSMRKELD